MKKIIDIITSRISVLIMIFAIMGCIIWQIYYINKSSKKENSKTYQYINEHGVEYLDSRVTHEIYQMLKDATEILDKNNIKYWADGGTLIGSIRNKGFIPWDCDLDIAILEEDIPKLLGLKEQLNILGYDVMNGKVLRIYPQSGILLSDTETTRYPFLDIFPMKILDGYYRHATEFSRKSWPKDKFKPENIETLVPCPFGAVTIKCPNNFEQTLKFLYGDDVLSHALATPPNYMFSYGATKRWKMSPTDYAPAPHGKLLDRVKKD